MKMTVYDDRFAAHIAERFAAEDDALARARAESEAAGLPLISIRAEEGRFLQLLARAVGARRAVEIGTLGGYSAIWIARGLASGGRLISLELSERHAEVARANVARAGLAETVEIRVGDAHASLAALSGAGPFDFCFIDANKTGYDAYLTWALANVRAGGAIAAHNAFRGGDVLDETKQDADTLAVRAILARFAREPRLASSVFPAGDGTVFGIVLSDA
jgi:caffeoyl-CoA O-methyltransferase